MKRPEVAAKLKGNRNSIRKPVICITTGEHFGSQKEAERILADRGIKVDDSNINRCCNGKRNYAGKLPDGTKLVWGFA